MRNFTEEQNYFRESVRKFFETEIAPHVKQARIDGIFDRSFFQKAGEQGFLLIWADEEYGGMGDKDFRWEQIFIEEAVRAGCAELFLTLHSRLVAPYIGNFGTAEQKSRWLPKCATGESILAVAMTEPDAGSDLAGMRASLVDAGDHFILNGSKTFISNGINADLVIVAAKSDPDNNPHAMTLVVVERGMEGFERGQNLEKMGMHAQDTAELFFNDVKIPKENILGQRDMGFLHLMQGLAEERLIAAVGNIASARTAFNLTRAYVMERKVFGKPLSKMQNTQFKMAEMEAEIDVLETYVDHCVQLSNAGLLTAEKAAVAKLQSSEIEWKMLDLGVQLHGGNGYMSEYEICQMFQGSRINRILAGSSEIMKLIISRHIFSDKYINNLD
jgi:acyl-CoA dehydrogenase